MCCVTLRETAADEQGRLFRNYRLVFRAIPTHSADAQCRDEFRTVGKCHRDTGVEGVDAVPGSFAFTCSALSGYRTAVENDEVAET